VVGDDLAMVLDLSGLAGFAQFVPDLMPPLG
jgi:hypothetical protein